MKSNWQSSTTGKLTDALLSMETNDEARRFLRDLLTPQEIVELGKRWQVAEMLAAGLPYSEIEKQTGMSSTTIARVSRFLNGKYGGYRLVLKRLKVGKRIPTLTKKRLDRDILMNKNSLSKYAFGLQNSVDQSHHHQAAKLEDGS